MRIKPGPALLLFGSAAMLSSVACKAKEGQDEVGSKPEAPPVTEPSQTESAPVPDAQGPTVLSETSTVLLDTKTDTAARWTVTDTDIRLRAAFAKNSEDAAKRDATIYAKVGETPEAEVLSCKAMLMEDAPRIEAMLRGDHLHLLCITPPAGGRLGFTDALRVTFDPAKLALTETGSYGGEGIVDPDTIDLDEGEGEL
ncbi:MAG: hypothetical protein GY811_09430 [Myxococcales bacterium]|nr:hypothetical protein [Myxococcales bacterium]